jgi:hypothetical protein
VQRLEAAVCRAAAHDQAFIAEVAGCSRIAARPGDQPEGEQPVG